MNGHLKDSNVNHNSMHILTRNHVQFIYSHKCDPHVTIWEQWLLSMEGGQQCEHLHDFINSRHTALE